MEEITVYAYELFDAAARTWIMAGGMATLPAIEGLHGVPVHSSAMVVASNRVDAHGFLKAPRRSNGC